MRAAAWAAALLSLLLFFLSVAHAAVVAALTPSSENAWYTVDAVNDRSRPDWAEWAVPLDVPRLFTAAVETSDDKLPAVEALACGYLDDGLSLPQLLTARPMAAFPTSDYHADEADTGSGLAGLHYFVSSNGFLTASLGSPCGSYASGFCPLHRFTLTSPGGSGQAAPMIGLLIADLDPSKSAASAPVSAFIPDRPSRCADAVDVATGLIATQSFRAECESVVVMYDRVPLYGLDPSEVLTAQVELYRNGTVVLRYRALPSPSVLERSQSYPGRDLYSAGLQGVASAHFVNASGYLADTTSTSSTLPRWEALRFMPRIQNQSLNAAACAAASTCAACTASDGCGWCAGLCEPPMTDAHAGVECLPTSGVCVPLGDTISMCAGRASSVALGPGQCGDAARWGRTATRRGESWTGKTVQSARAVAVNAARISNDSVGVRLNAYMAQPVSPDVASAAQTGQRLLYYSASTSTVDVPVPFGPGGAGWVPAYPSGGWSGVADSPTRIVVGSLGIASTSLSGLVVYIFDTAHAALNPTNVTVVQTPAVRGTNASSFPCPLAVTRMGTNSATVTNDTCIASTLVTWRGFVINLPVDTFSLSFEATLLLVPGGYIAAGLKARYRYVNGATGALQMPVGLQGVVFRPVASSTRRSVAARPLGSTATGATGVAASDAEEPGIAAGKTYTDTFAPLNEPVTAQWSATGTVAIVSPTAACIACSNGLCNAATGACVCAAGADPSTGCDSCLAGYVSVARPVVGGVACVRCPCRNGGVCRPTPNAVFTPMRLAQRCLCPAGYDGALCEFACSAAIAPRAVAHPPALNAAWRGALTTVLVIQRIYDVVAASDIGGVLIRFVCTSAADASANPRGCGGLDVFRAADASATRTSSYRSKLEVALDASAAATCACGRCYYVGPEASSGVMFPTDDGGDVTLTSLWVGVALLIAVVPSLVLVVLVSCFRRCVRRHRAAAWRKTIQAHLQTTLPPPPIVAASAVAVPAAVRAPPAPPPPPPPLPPQPPAVAEATVKTRLLPQPSSARQAIVDLLISPHSYDFTSPTSAS